MATHTHTHSLSWHCSHPGVVSNILRTTDLNQLVTFVLNKMLQMIFKKAISQSFLHFYFKTTVIQSVVGVFCSPDVPFDHQFHHTETYSKTDFIFIGIVHESHVPTSTHFIS